MPKGNKGARTRARRGEDSGGHLYTVEDGKLQLHLHPGQTQAWDSEKRFIFVLAGTQSGKGLYITTPIPTPDGWKEMGDISVGDIVFDDRGDPCAVTFVTPVMYDHDCYKVTFTDGCKIIADGDHQWRVRTVGTLKYSVVNTRDIIDKARTGGALDRYAIDTCEKMARPVERFRYFESIVPVDSVPVRCIQVDSYNGTYLASRDYIVTHNTSFAPWWLNERIMDTWQPGGDNDYLAVTSSFDLFKLKFLPEMTRVFCDVLGIGRWYASDRMIEIKCLDPDDPRYMQFYAETANDPMWARIVLRSAQSEGGLESTTARAAVMDECGQPGFSLQSWEAIQRRLSLTQGRVLGITTPYNLGWLYTHIYLPWLNGDPDIDIVQFSSHMNPSFPMKEYERAKAKLPDWRFAMFYDGQFRRPAGLIYQDFNEITMTCEPFEIDKSWEHVVGVDFGGANNATLWMARNPDDNRWYVYHESLMGHKSTADHVRSARDTAYGVADLTAVGGAVGETQQRLDWDTEGFVIDEPPVFDLEAGISRVISLIKSDRLRIFRNLRGILNDLGGYRRKLDESGEPTNDIVFKKRFHFCDSLRYACTWIEDEGGTDILGYGDFRKRYNNNE